MWLAANQKPDFRTINAIRGEKLKKAIKQIESDHLPRKEKHGACNAEFKERYSFSKTDKNATFIRMKEDAMLNGQLKPSRSEQRTGL